MVFAPDEQVTTCVTLRFSTVADLISAATLVAIPAVAIVVVARIARLHPSRALLSRGRRPAGVRVNRAGLAVAGLGLAGLIAAMIVGLRRPEECDQASGLTAVVAIGLILLGALLIGGGWAYAVRAPWVVPATLAALDVWIFAINVVVSLDSQEPVQGLLLLAFVIHAICISVAARWSLTARDLGPVERAMAGEAGRTLAAVWVFLASYSGLALFRGESGIFSTAAGSAVTGALSLGALAVTMGSGFTKYSEAIHATPAAAPEGPQAALGEPGGDSGDAPAVAVPPRPADDSGAFPS